MSVINVYMDSGEAAPVASVGPFWDGRRYIWLRAGSVSLTLPGFDAENVAYARSMASALTAAADELEAALKANDEVTL